MRLEHVLIIVILRRIVVDRIHYFDVAEACKDIEIKIVNNGQPPRSLSQLNLNDLTLRTGFQNKCLRAARKSSLTPNKMDYTSSVGILSSRRHTVGKLVENVFVSAGMDNSSKCRIVGSFGTDRALRTTRFVKHERCGPSTYPCISTAVDESSIVSSVPTNTPAKIWVILSPAAD